MSETRTRREKLAAMAAQSASPQEAAVARRMLEEYDAAHPVETAHVLTMEERMDRLRDIARGWTPGLRVKVVDEDDDLFAASVFDWDGRS